jgi:hypothetical protein
MWPERGCDDNALMIDKFNPPTVHEPAGYSHVTISNVGCLAHLAGQCPLDLSGEVITSMRRRWLRPLPPIISAAGADD